MKKKSKDLFLLHGAYITPFRDLCPHYLTFLIKVLPSSVWTPKQKELICQSRLVDSKGDGRKTIPKNDTKQKIIIIKSCHVIITTSTK